MEWFLLPAPVPGSVEFTVGSGSVFVAMLATALTPLALAARQAVKRADLAFARPLLRVIEGGKEPNRQAA